MLFVLFSFFGMLIVLAVIYMNWQDVKQKAEADLGHVNTFVYSAFEADLYKYESLLRLLGDRLQEMNVLEDPEKGRALLERTLKMNPNLAGFGLAEPDGNLVLVTGVAKGVPLPNLLAQEKSCDSFRRALQNGHITLGRTYYMKLLGKWVVPLRVPIYGKDGKISFMMTTGIDLQSTQNIWQPKNLPEDISALLVDDDYHFIFVSPLDEHSMAEWYNGSVRNSTTSQVDVSGLRQLQKMVLDINDRDGKRQLVLAEYHPAWKIFSITTIPYSSLTGSLFAQLRYFLLGILLFYGLSLGLYLMMNRQDRVKTRELLWNANHDPLTGLPNRFFLRKKSYQWCRQHRVFSALFLDLDNFKGVNDNYGHPFGDRLLGIIADRLQQFIDPHEYIIRHGGDEFIILTTRPQDELSGFALRIREAVCNEVILDEIVLHPSASIGIAHYPKDADNIDTLLSKADLALYEAKQRKIGYFKYSPVLEEKAKRRYTVELHLRRANIPREFYVLFQPQFDAKTLDFIGVESLIRWRNPAMGEVDPHSFIPVAEETAVIREIGLFVLEQSCLKALEIWEKTGKRFRLSVNTSAEELLYGDYVGQLLSILEMTGFPGTMLTIEVTESVFIRRVQQAKTVLNALRQHGVGVSLDDFGTGYSSLSILGALPLTELKIDKSFVTHIMDDSQRLAIAKSIVSLGQTLDLEVVAEGADASQLDLLRSIGCTVLQGFDYGLPMTPEKLTEFILARKEHASRPVFS